MRRRTAVLLTLAVALVLLWGPVLYPGGKAALVLLDIYSAPLVGTNLAALITPEPRYTETRGTFGGLGMRVSWWRPGWGDRHPAIMLVNGATPLGNDNEATRQFGTTLARAGYLVMLPEFPFSKEGRLDPEAPRVVDAAFAHLRGLPETEGRPAGAFGASTGAGLMLAAAGTLPALGRADHLSVLGGYFDLDTYVAAVATRSMPGGVGWEPSEEARQRIPPAVEAAMTDVGDKVKIRRVFTLADHRSAMDELASLSARGREVLDRLSPATAWSAVAPPVFWIHDPNDSYEPLSEAYAAQAAPRSGRFVLAVPRLIQHAEVGGATKGQDPLSLVRELAALLAFTLEVLRIAG
ncbi:MAG: hypothetical protein HYY42_03785 [Chloroflexi bacterium]|nr:hypothetical protein [Chloroflexota bacterium]